MTTMTTIEREILVEAPIATVWRTITEPAQIEQWFADRAELDVRPGGTGTLTFEGDEEHSGTARVLVEAVDEPTRFAFRWSAPEGEAPTAGNTVLVTFTLAAEGPTSTRLRVEETGVADLGWTADAAAAYARDHNEGWAHHLGRIGDVLGSPAA